MYEKEDRLTDNTELMNKQLTFNFLNQGLISEEVVQLQHRIETSTGNIIDKKLEAPPYSELLYLSLSRF